MTSTTAKATAPRLHVLAAGFLMVAMAAVVGGALAFQHIGGYLPCKLCYGQRIPYYVGVPVMALSLLSAVLGAPGWLTRLLLLVGALLMVWSVYLGVYHAGVEWAWWPGPTDCQVDDLPEGGSGGVLDQIDKIVPPSCDKPALTILGLSLAGWNAIASVFLALVAFRGAAAKA